MQRLQKIAFIRANAPRVSLTIPYLADSTSRFVTYRRFVTVHYPARGLDEAVIEITGRPTLSLKKLTISVEGIVVSADLYDFDAATEEGEPPPTAEQVIAAGIPVPQDFVVNFGTETLSGGATSVYAIGSWTHVSDAFTYDFEYQLADASEPPRTVTTHAGEIEARTAALSDSASYRFRVRTRSNGVAGAWTSYITDTAEADTVAPGEPTGFIVVSAAVDAEEPLQWNNPNSPNLHRTDLYRAINSVDFADAVLISTSYAAPAAIVLYRGKFSSGVASAVVGPVSATAP
jgi:hypothetical protein